MCTPREQRSNLNCKSTIVCFAGLILYQVWITSPKIWLRLLLREGLSGLTRLKLFRRLLFDQLATLRALLTSVELELCRTFLLIFAVPRYVSKCYALLSVKHIGRVVGVQRATHA